MKFWQRCSRSCMLNVHARLMKRGRFDADIVSASRKRPQLTEMSSTSYFLLSSRRGVILDQSTWLFVSYMPLMSWRTLAAVSSSCSLDEAGMSESRLLHRYPHIHSAPAFEKIDSCEAHLRGSCVEYTAHAPHERVATCIDRETTVSQLVLARGLETVPAA